MGAAPDILREIEALRRLFERRAYGARLARFLARLRRLEAAVERLLRGP